MPVATAFNAIFLLLWGYQVQRYFLQSKEVNRSRLEKACFLIGVSTWVVCVCDPLAYLSTTNLSAHMMTQLAIMMIATPLVLFSKPSLDICSPKLENLKANQIWVRTKTSSQHPIFTWAIFVAALIAIHMPNIVNWSYLNPIGSRLTQALLLPVIAALYFQPILQSQKHEFSFALRIMSLFLMMIPETMIGFFIYIQNRIIYRDFLPGTNLDISLSQQQLAGALMWSMSMIVDSIWIAVAVQRWFESEKQEGQKINAEIYAENEALGLEQN
jgi:putative membrane protein